MSTDPATRIEQYEMSWNTIRNSAIGASTSITDLINFCTANANSAETTYQNTDAPGYVTLFVATARAQATAVSTTIVSTIQPVLARADAAAIVVAKARALMEKVRADLNSGATTTNAHVNDLQTLQTMPPTTLDASNAQQEAQALGTAVASPAGSLNISGGSVIDQMRLISTNAAELKDSVCTLRQPNRFGSGDD